MTFLEALDKLDTEATAGPWGEMWSVKTDNPNIALIALLRNTAGEVRALVKAANTNCEHEGGDEALGAALDALDARARELMGGDDE